MKVLMTGGHHTSALPIISRLREKVPNVQLVWVGHKHSLKGNKNTTLEYREITSLNIPFYTLTTGKFYKSLSLKNIFKIMYGFIYSIYLIFKIKPNVIVSFGGYLSVPIVFAGWLFHIPILVHEQTLVVGYANRFNFIFATKVLVSWESSLKYAPKDKTLVTGVPLREDIFKVVSNSFDAKNDLPYIYVTGGKTGSHKINEVMQMSLGELLQKFNLIIQCGDYSKFNDYAKFNDIYSSLTKSKHVAGKLFLRKFVLKDEIGEAYARASLVVCRSGAHTVSELLALGKKAVLIPIPWVSHNEQYENARVVVDAGLGKILDESSLTKDTLLDAINFVYNLDTRSYSNAKFKQSRNLVVDTIVDEILKAASNAS